MLAILCRYCNRKLTMLRQFPIGFRFFVVDIPTLTLSFFFLFNTL